MPGQRTRLKAPQPAAPPNGGGASRRRIEEVALELFATHGFRGTSVKDLMLACGLTPGALYNHFPSKDDLLYSLISQSSDELDELIQASTAEAGEEPDDQLFHLVQAIALFAIRHPKATKLANVDYVELPEALRKNVIKFRQELRRWMERLIEAGVAAGIFTVPRFDGKNDVKLAATAMANVAVRLSESYGPYPKGDPEALARFHADLALRMVRAHS
jgi:AcrR family transcriptional regulator